MPPQGPEIPDSYGFVLPSVIFRLRVFDSGVMVIELQSHKEEEMVASALETVREPRLPPVLGSGHTKTWMLSNSRNRISFCI